MAKGNNMAITVQNSAFKLPTKFWRKGAYHPFPTYKQIEFKRATMDSRETIDDKDHETIMEKLETTGLQLDPNAHVSVDFKFLKLAVSVDVDLSLLNTPRHKAWMMRQEGPVKDAVEPVTTFFLLDTALASGYIKPENSSRIPPGKMPRVNDGILMFFRYRDAEGRYVERHPYVNWVDHMLVPAYYEVARHSYGVNTIKGAAGQLKMAVETGIKDLHSVWIASLNMGLNDVLGYENISVTMKRIKKLVPDIIMLGKSDNARTFELLGELKQKSGRECAAHIAELKAKAGLI